MIYRRGGNRVLVILLILSIVLVACKKEAENQKPNNIDKCSELVDSNEKDHCYLSAALETNDFLACDKIITNNMKGPCYATLIFRKEMESTICDKFDQEFTDNCYYSLAGHKLDITLCDNIADEKLNSNCLLNTEIQINKASD